MALVWCWSYSLNKPTTNPVSTISLLFEDIKTGFLFINRIYRFINKIVAFFKKYKHKQGYVNNLILYIYSRYLFYKGLEEYKKGKIKTVKDLDDFLEKL